MAGNMAKDSETTRRWVIRIIVYLMLFASAGAVFLLDNWMWQSVHAGLWPVWVPLIPMIMFTIFVVVYVIDRWLLVTRRRYPQLRAFFQVGIAVSFLAFLWQQQAKELRNDPMQVNQVNTIMQMMLNYTDPNIRSAACHLVGYLGLKELRGLVERLADEDVEPGVRKVCQQTVVKLH
ncbi:MAG: hypothetical protein JW841_17550 [Deltaproteobacteria bacterium]|nr:hypothetical protein [Deltaproteobacteria bacterium]